MTWYNAIELNVLKSAGRKTVTVNNHKLLLISKNDALFAVQSQCPHLKLPLEKGSVSDDCVITCPFHHSEFDLKTGAVKCWSPWPKFVGTLLGKLSKQKALQTYPVQVEGDWVQVDL
jgi:nitrite reductase/ring-hydroxylating ferredoxin subunit